MMLWSRFPLTEVDWEPMEHRPAVIATVCLPDGAAVRVVLAHPNPPTTPGGLRHWEPSLEAIHLAASSPGPPTLIVADLNAARWHPPFRRLLRRGWRDVHEAAGRGLSVSWPTAGRWPLPFVRLDHGLVGDGLGVVSVPRRRRPRQRPPRLRRGALRRRRQSRGRALSSAANARPRCEIAFFSSAVISLKARPSPSSGTNSGS